MRILIAGASGFVGSRLVQQLFADGYDLITVSRKPNGKNARPEIQESFTWEELKSGVADHLKVDVIINLAGESIASGRWTRLRRERIIRSRVNASRALSSFAKRLASPPSLFVQASAIGYYGYKVIEPTDESGPKGVGFLSDVVHEWENSISVPPETRNIIARLGVVIGNGGAMAKISMSSPFGFLIVPAGGRQKVSYIHIRDLCTFISEAIKNNEYQGVINLAAPEPVTLRAILKPLNKIMIGVPGLFFKLILGDMARETILADQNVISEVLTRKGFTFLHADPSELIRTD